MTLSTLRLALLTAIAGCGGGRSQCENPRPHPTVEGLEQCDDGSVNRVEDPGADPVGSCLGTEPVLYCATDADCGGTSVCESWTEYDGTAGGCQCRESCATDADCGPGAACLPPGPWGRQQCAPASCLTNDDCDREECGVFATFDGCQITAVLACRTRDDACRAQEDCPSDEGCTPAEDATAGPVTCRNTSECAIGRPLLVDGAPRVAPLAPRRRGAAPVEPLPHDLDAAHAWAHLAALEHASIGSFARFTLQLLALGAPADLLADTQRAALDEVRHAQLAYVIAERLGLGPVGPGPLDLADAAPGLDAHAALRGLLDEACVGETVGALEAAEGARLAVYPDIAAHLLQVADDEARHAALAWRCLRWLLDTHPHLRDEAVSHLQRVCAAEPQGHRRGHPEVGLLSDADRRALWRRAVEEVVGPCVAALA